MMNDLYINRKYLIYISIFFVIYCMFLSWSFLFQNVDDAYISFRYGKNFMEGRGLVFNEGEHVEGYTNFLWTLITAPFTQIPSVDVSVFALTFGLIISIVNIFLILKVTSEFTSSFSGVPKYFVLLPVLLFILDDTIAFWAIGGMELPSFIMFILLAVYFYYTLSGNNKNIYWLSVSLMLCTLSRPEGNMIFGLTILHMLLHRKKITMFKQNLAIVLGSYTLFFILYYGFKYSYYGNILPNTFYAKGVTDISMNLILGSKYVIQCAGIRMYVLIFILMIPFLRAFKSFKLSYLLSISAAYVIYIIIVGGDWMYANRFFVPIIPLLYILSSIGLVYLYKKIVKSEHLKVKKINNYFITGTIILCTALFVVTFTQLEYKRLIIDENNSVFERQWSRFGQWLKLNCESGTIIAVGPAGKVPYYSELYSIDMWGLNNDYIGKTKSKRLQAGHKKFDFDYVLSFKPEFIIGGAESFDEKDMPSEYERFNPDDPYYKCYDIVYRLKNEFRTMNK